MSNSDSSNINIVPGFVVDGRYEILNQIGAGGFSTVYRVKHVTMNREAAIKILSLELLGGDSNWKERFMREAQICAAFSHPNVVTIYDLGTIPETGQPYIAMELLQGHNLAVELSKNGPLSKQRFFRLFRPVLDALGAGHAAGIIHRDLKPENLFIINPGTPSEFMKVMDFGVSRMRRQDLKRLTMKGELLGTPRFLAPEYIKESIVCPAGDVYQMALIMSEALSGVPAIEDNSMAAMLMHTEGNINICEFLKTGSVGSVFSKAYCVDKNQRYADCRQFCDAFDTISRFFDPQSAPSITEDKLAVSDVAEGTDNSGDDDFNVKTESGVKHLALLIFLSIVIGALCVIIIVFLVLRSEQTDTVDNPPVVVSEPEINENVEPAFDEMSLVEPLHLCKLEETPELQALRKDAEESNEAKENLAVYLMRLPKCRDNFDEAWKAFDGINIHNNADAMFFHGLLGMKRWSQEFHVNTADEMLKFNQYVSYIYEAAKRGSLIAIAGVFRLLDNPIDHKERAQLILDAMNNSDGTISDTKNWFRIAQGVQLAINNSDNSSANVKIYREVLDKVKNMLKAADENDPTFMTIQAMMIAKTDPDKSYHLFRKAADAGSVEANRVLAEVYMYAMTDKLNFEINFPVEAYKALQKIVQKKVKSLDEADRFKLVADYIKHSGTDALNVYSFYRALPYDSDEFIDVILDRMRDFAVNDVHVRFECNQLADKLGVDITGKTNHIDNIFPERKQQKILEIVEDCYRAALEQGSDFSEFTLNDSEFSSGYVLYLLYNNAFDYQSEEIKNKAAGTLLYAAMHGDGVSAGILAKEYQKGEILPVNAERHKYWVTQCIESQVCHACQKMDLAVCSICDECQSMAKGNE